MEDKKLTEIINKLKPISIQCQMRAFFIYTVNGKYNYTGYENINNLGDNINFILMMINGKCLNIISKNN